MLFAPILVVASCSSGSGTGSGSGTRIEPDPGPGAGAGHGQNDPSHDPGQGHATDPGHGPTPASTGARVVLEPPGHDPVTVRVEVANTDPLRMRGLMYRETLAEDAGMIFLFDDTEHLTFWMRNTLVPLDMVFITADKRVLGVVENATPQTDDPREVPGDSRYVLEVNAGFARRTGVTAGTLVRFVDIPEGAEPRGGHAQR